MSKNLFNLLLISVAVGSYFLLIGPLYRGNGIIWEPKESIKSLRVSNEQYSQALVQAAQLYSQAQNLDAEYESIDDETKEKMKKMVPEDIDPVRLLSEINGIANSQGLALINMTYKENAPQTSTVKTTSNTSSVPAMPIEPTNSTASVPMAVTPNNMTGGQAKEEVISKQGSYTVSFSVKTTYPKVKDLVRSLETSLRLYTIRHAKLTSSEDSALDEFSIEIETYYLQ